MCTADAARTLRRAAEAPNRRGNDRPRCRRLVSLAAVPLLVLAAVCFASESGLSGVEGHPRARFPLALYLGTAGDAALDAAAHRAVNDWNAVAQDVLGAPAFRETPARADAHVLVTFKASTGERLMGQASLEIDDRGRIELPVQIEIFQPEARGQTSRELVLYQVLGHELGHALGLPHVRDPRSLMCCIKGSVNFNDPAQRDAYVEGRRHPDVRTARAALAAHYERFWKTSR